MAAPANKKKAESNNEVKSKPKKEDDAPMIGSLSDLRQFLREVYIEFQKISWPGRQQVVRETISVIVLVSVITLLVLAFDWGVAKAVFEPLDHLARQYGGGMGVHTK